MNKKVLFFLAVLILVFTFFANFYLSKTGRRSRASEGEKVKVIFNPSSLSGQPNTQLSAVKIQGQPLSSSNNPTSITIRGYRFNLNFNKNLLEVVSLTYPSSCPEVAGVSSTVGEANNSGLIKVACANTTSSGYLMPSNFSDLLIIVFKARSNSGNTNLTIDESFANSGFSKIKTDGTLGVVSFADSSNFSLSVIISSPSSNTPNLTPTSTPIPTSTPTPTPTTEGESGVTLNLKLKFQGIPQKPANQYNKLTVKITAVSSSGIKKEANVDFTADDINDNKGVWLGKVNLSLTPGSGYRILVKGPKHIQKKVCVNNPSESYPGSYRCAVGEITLKAGVNDLDFSGILMLAGDLPEQDGVVNSYDTSLVRNNLRKNDDESLRLADINLDGIVDTQDYSLIIAALSVRADEE